MKTFKLPDLGEGLPDAIIREWYVSEGETVTKDQPMVAMETAKALVDVPVPFSGKIDKLFGQVGDTIDTGNPLIGFAGDTDNETNDAGTVVGSIDNSATLLDEGASHHSSQQSNSARVKILPAVRMLAKQLGVDLTSLQPKGDHITADDVKRAAQLAPSMTQSERLSGKFTPLSNVRRAMAISMTQAHQQVVPATIMDEANLHQWTGKQDITLRIIRALVDACQQVPQLNDYYDGEQMASQHNEPINLGIAVDTEHGLYVPVLKNIADRDNHSLRADIDRFKQQAQDRSIPQQDLKGATILMSNVGAIAGQYAAPVVTPPMVAIIAIGRIKKTVALDNNQAVTHSMLPISITFDHRPITGGEAARFLKAMINSLEKSTH